MNRTPLICSLACLLQPATVQEGFKPVAKAMHGFAWRAERPDMPTFVEQKWGYRAEKRGGSLHLHRIP